MPPKNSRKSSQKLVFPHPVAPRSTPAAPRSFTVLPGGPTVSTQFNTVHPGRAPLPGPPRFTQVGLPFPVLQGSPRWFLTCQKSPERPPVHPGPSGIIPVHHGGTTVQPPVLPGSPRSMDRGEPGSTGSPVGLGHKSRLRKDYTHT